MANSWGIARVTSLRGSDFFGLRLANTSYEGLVASSIFFKIFLCLAKTQGSIRAAAHFLRVVFILPVIFPPTDRTHFETTSTMKGLEFAARTPICFCFFSGFEDTLKHRDR